MEFFSPIEEDTVSRTEQDEDAERIAQQTRKRAGNAGQVFAVVRALSLSTFIFPSLLRVSRAI